MFPRRSQGCLDSVGGPLISLREQVGICIQRYNRVPMPQSPTHRQHVKAACAISADAWLCRKA
jgi:hypothetical protein